MSNAFGGVSLLNRMLLIHLGCTLLFFCYTAESGRCDPPGIQTDLYGDALPWGAVQRLGTTRYRYAGQQKRALFIPDSGSFVVGSSNSAPEVFDVETGRRLRHAAPGAQGNSLLAVSRNGDLAVLTFNAEFVNGAHPVELRLRKGKQGTAVSWSEPPAARIRLFAISPDAELAVTVTSHGRLVLRKARTGDVVAVHEIGAMGQELIDWSPNGQWVAVSTRKGVLLWDCTSSEPPALLEEFGRRGAEAVRFSHDSQSLALAYLFRPNVDLFDVTTRKRISELMPGDGATHRDSICFSADDRHLYVPNRLDRTVDVFDLRSSELTHSFHADQTEPRHIDVSADGTRLVAVGPNELIAVWDVATRALISARSVGHADRISRIVFTESDREVLTGESDGSIRLWNAQSGEQIRTFPAARSEDRHTSVTGLEASLKKRLLASCGRDDTVRIWSLDSGEQLHRLPGHGKAGVVALAFSPDGEQLLSCGEDGILRRWNTATGQRAAPDIGIEAPFRTAWFDARAEHLCCYDALGFSVYNVNAATWTGHAKYPHGLRQARISPDRSTAAVGWTQPDRSVILNPHQLRLYAFDDEEPTHKIPLKSYVLAIRFSADSRFVAVSCAANSDQESEILIASVASGEQLARILTKNAVTQLEFSPTGRYLTTAQDDTSALIWDLEEFGVTETPD